MLSGRAHKDPVTWEKILFPFLEVTVSIYRGIQKRRNKKNLCCCFSSILKKRSIPRLAQGYRDEKVFGPKLYTLGGS